MNVKKCANGHFYDADKYQSCPHCSAAVGDAVQASVQIASIPQAQYIKKQSADADVEVKPMPEKAAGRTFGVFDESAKTPVKEETIKSAPVVSFTKPLDEISCPNCGKALKSGVKFCKYCGSPVKTAEPVARPAEVKASVYEAVMPATAEAQGAEVPEPVCAAETIKVLDAKEIKSTVEILSEQMPEASIPEPQAPTMPGINPADEPVADIASESVAEFIAETVANTAEESVAEPAPEPVAEPEPESEEEFKEAPEVSLQQAVRNAVSGSEGKTVGFFSMGKDEEEISADPVVGWLVCTKGKHLGECFCIYAGRNSVGRGVSNKIVLSRDNTVSREKHVWITYDPRNKDFYIQPGEGSGLAYLNSETILGTKKMAAKDIIEIGKGSYMLIPLCGEDFSWEDYI